ncbi:MAG: PAS domain-containing protein, partial [Coprobacillus sp.]
MEGIKKQDALMFTHNLITLYFSKRDMNSLPQYMEERTSWIGTGTNELSKNLNDAIEALQNELSEYHDSFDVVDTQLEFVSLSNTSCIVYGKIKAIPRDPTFSNEDLRISIIIEQIDHELKLVHMHFSHADDDQEDGSYFIKQSNRTDKETLRMSLDVKERQLANLTKNIPGGAHQCANDSELTLLSMSDGFLSMFGYTKEDIETLFNGKYLNMIYVNDRAEVTKNLQEQLKHGSNIDLEYRVICKNGQPVWVLDKGRLINDGKGGYCFYCLLIDITKRKCDQEELRLSLERHQVIMDQATDII